MEYVLILCCYYMLLCKKAAGVDSVKQALALLDPATVGYEWSIQQKYSYYGANSCRRREPSRTCCKGAKQICAEGCLKEDVVRTLTINSVGENECCETARPLEAIYVASGQKRYRT